AQNDIDRATTVARQMVTEFGMSESLGPMRFGHPQGEVFLGRDLTSRPDYSEEVAANIDDEVRALIDAAHRTALDVLTANRVVLALPAADLMWQETREAERVQALFRDVTMWNGNDGRGAGRASRRPDTAPAP